MAPIVRLSGVDKVYGTRPVLQNIQFELREKDRILLFGPNGVGKSTLLKILASLTPPTSGSISFYEDRAGLRLFRRRMGYLGHESLLYPDLSGEENLLFFAALRGLGRDRCRSLLAQVGLDGEAAQRRVRFYSAGMKQRLSVARALLHDPEILLLDEPFNALDSGFVSSFLQWIRSRTVVMVTHQVELARSVATRQFEVGNGKVVEKLVGAA
ncbi:MAG TPA: ABC transporter ATP-binding protein [Acidobacteriota bacterium]|jgi:ABC-type multidrug transport system ATPase subunit